MKSFLTVMEEYFTKLSKSKLEKYSQQYVDSCQVGDNLFLKHVAILANALRMLGFGTNINRETNYLHAFTKDLQKEFRKNASKIKDIRHAYLMTYINIITDDNGQFNIKSEDIDDKKKLQTYSFYLDDGMPFLEVEIELVKFASGKWLKLKDRVFVPKATVEYLRNNMAQQSKETMARAKAILDGELKYSSEEHD